MHATALGELIRVGPIEVRFRLEAPQTAGILTMFEFLVPRGARVPAPHSHEAFDETLYGLEGVNWWTVDGRSVEVGPGDVLFIRRGSVHQFENRGMADARTLSVITPGLLGPEYFREIGEVLNGGGPPDLRQIVAVMQRHGLRPVPHMPSQASA
jgi:quercetin dioxygenase-like cupin family protein